MLKSYHAYAEKVGYFQKSIVLTESIDVADVGPIELGQHKLIDIVTLCIDIRASTIRSAKESIHDSIRVLNVFFSSVAQVLADGEAIIDKYPGDGVMAHFLVNREGALRAVKAACIIRGLVDEEINPLLERDSLQPISCGVSLDAPGAETALACVGIPRHSEIIALGNSVNIAAKMEKNAGDRVLIGHDVYRRLGTDIQRHCTRVDSYGFHYGGTGKPYPLYSVNWSWVR